MGEKKSLIVLLDERHEVAERLEDAVNPAELMEKMEAAVQVKASGIAMYCEKLDAMIDAVDATIRKLQARKNALKNRKESLKEYTLAAMQTHGIKKIECPECTISIQKNPPSVEVFEERLIPGEYWKQPAPVLDKKALLEDMKEGLVIDGCCLKQSEGLRIR